MRYRLMPSGTLLNKSTPAFDPTHPLYTQVFPFVGSLSSHDRSELLFTLGDGCWLSLCACGSICFCLFVVLLNNCKYLKVNSQERSSNRPPQAADVIVL